MVLALHPCHVPRQSGVDASTKGTAMPLSICETCGTQYAEAPHPPAHCPVCEDERQYVGWQGQRWTTHEALGAPPAARRGKHPVGMPRPGDRRGGRCVESTRRRGPDHHFASALLFLDDGME